MALTQKRNISDGRAVVGVQNICIGCIHVVLKLCMREKKERRKTKLTFSHLIFSTLRKGSATLGVDCRIE